MAVADPAPPRWYVAAQRPRAVAADSRADACSTGSAFSLVFVVTLVAIAVPLLAPHDPLVPVGMPLQAPGKNGFLLGTDSVGRDILSPGALRRAVELVRRPGRDRRRAADRRPRRADRRRDRRLGRHRADAHHRRVPVAARAGAGDRRGRRARARLRPHADRGVDRLVAVLRPDRARRGGPTRRPTARRGRATRRRRPDSGSPAATCCPARCRNALVTASLDIGTLILTLAALSFLGLGQSAPAPELGADTARNLSYFLQQWWIPVMPGLAVLVLALDRQHRRRRPAQPDEDELGARMKTFVATRLGAMVAILVALTGGDVRAAAHLAARPGEGAARRAGVGRRRWRRGATRSASNQPMLVAVLALPDRRGHGDLGHVLPHPARRWRPTSATSSPPPWNSRCTASCIALVLAVAARLQHDAELAGRRRAAGGAVHRRVGADVPARHPRADRLLPEPRLGAGQRPHRRYRTRRRARPGC